MVHRVQNLAFGYPEGRIELQLIGGYRDQPGGYAEDLFYNIMRKSILQPLFQAASSNCMNQMT